MKIDFSQSLLTLNGASVKEHDGSPATLAVIATNALLMPYSDEQTLPGTDKVRRYELARKIHASGEIELSVEDVTLIKQLVGKAYAPLIVGQAWKMLDG